MIKMEDSGFDSDSKSNCLVNKSENFESPASFHSVTKGCFQHEDLGEAKCDCERIKVESCMSENSSIRSESPLGPTANLMSSSLLQKRLDAQILQTKKHRQKEQALLETVPKKIIPRSRLKVPKKSQQIPIVSKTDSHPLVSWESESEDEFDFSLASRKGAREITQQLIKDGYNLDLTPDDEDLDLIPPKPFKHRCTCCNPAYLCILQ